MAPLMPEMMTIAPPSRSGLPPAATTRGEVVSTALEPVSLVDAFMQNPPERFAASWIQAGNHSVPAFFCLYDLRTTLDDANSGFMRWVRSSKWLGLLTSFRTTFIGTTVSEYAPVPRAEDSLRFVRGLIGHHSNSQLVIIKDVPKASPLLPGSVAPHADALIDEAARQGYIIVEGQALAYVPIDFADLDEYMSRLSSTRRKEFRKKLKSRSLISIEQMKTGCAALCDQHFLDQLYALYLNVYEQSEYHFDKLSREFFASVLSDAQSGGVLFVYKLDGEIIGWNLCFIHNNMLVDKYVGFAYPQARQYNLYFVSWFTNLEFALEHRLKYYIAGWTDPEVKRSLGARFTFTRHAVYIRNPLLRAILTPIKNLFEADANWSAQSELEAKS
jgi:hypothetical protein